MPRFPRTSGDKVVAALRKLGFEVVRQRGSHVVLRRRTEGRVQACVVPLHSSLAVGTLAGILDQAGLAANEFLSAL